MRFTYNGNENVEFDVENLKIYVGGTVLDERDMWAIINGGRIMDNAEYIFENDEDISSEIAWDIANRIDDELCDIECENLPDLIEGAKEEIWNEKH